MRAEVDVRPVRERRRARRLAALRSVPWRTVGIWGGASLAALVLATGVVFAGKPGTIPAGVTVAGVKLSGQTPAQAVALLQERSAEYADRPVVFTAGGSEFRLTPAELDAVVDWEVLAAQAEAKGDWPMPFRGIKRVGLRLFGSDVEARADVFEPRLAHELETIATAVDAPGRDAAIVLRGLEPSIEPDREGRTLNRREAGDEIVVALAGFDREPVALPIAVARPKVTADELEPVVAEVRTALSAPVRFGWRDAHWSVLPADLADLLLLPAEGRSELAIGGPAAKKYFAGLARGVNRKPRNAAFTVGDDGVTVGVAPSQDGRKLDTEASGEALLTGALATETRKAELVVVPVEARLTTERAKAMKISRVLASYTTAYSGTYDRIQNLQIGTELLHGTTLGPGVTFSFNDVVGPRTLERGFRPAPTIMNNEYEDHVGGGVSQVATTVFNAAWEAGLKIAERTAHSLYIDRYQLGRDATVNYPDVDLKFVNDTENWIYIQGIVTEGGITIRLLGAPTDRRVVSEAGELRETGEPEVENVPDPTLHVGEKVVEDEGEPSRSVTVTRVVYEGDDVLYEESWVTNYASEPKIVRVGTIPVVEPPPPPVNPPAPPPPPSSTNPTTTSPTTTGKGR
jgi:vancomycin resistance protein YoaR